MREYAEQGNDLIIGEVFGVEQRGARGGRGLSRGRLPDGLVLPAARSPNFSVFDNFIHEPSYLTGMIAGGTTKSNVIGMVGGYAIPEVNRLMNAFMAGALSVNPDVKFLVTFISSWYDPPKAKEAAFAMIDAGADVMYAERFGVSDAAKERGVKAIGNVIDTSADYPGTILASALWHMEPSVDTAIAAVIDGSYAPADYGKYSYMGDGRRLVRGRRGAGRPGAPREGQGQGSRDQGRHLHRRGQRRRAEVDDVRAATGPRGTTRGPDRRRSGGPACAFSSSTAPVRRTPTTAASHSFAGCGLLAARDGRRCSHHARP